MKLKCSRGRLHEALSLATMVVPQRTTIPAVMNVRCSATKKGKSGGVLELSCTDLEYGLKLTLPAEIMEEGTVVLPAGRMSGILREAGEEEITLTADGNLAQIRTNDAKFKVVGIDPADFPMIPTFEDRGAIEVPSDHLGEMIRKTQFAVSNEVVRYALTGLLFEIRKSDVRMVASDGKRLSFVKTKASNKDHKKNLKVIVPTKTMNLLDKVLSEEDEIVALNIEETQIRLKTSRAVIFSRLIEGNFPDYEAVIPKGHDKKIPLDREEFLSAVRKASLMTSDKSRAVKFEFGKGTAALFTRTQDVGEVRVEFPVDYKGAKVEIVFNPDYVQDYLKAVSSDEIELALKDGTSAGLFRAGKDYQYVLMPLTVTL